MTVGSTIQNLSVCTPGAATTCVVTVTLALLDVLLSHCRFIVVSSAPVTLVTLTICGAAPSIDTAYLRPSVGRTLLRGDRMALTETVPLDVSVIVYSRCGLLPPGVYETVSGATAATPSPVLPMPGRPCQPGPTALE